MAKQPSKTNSDSDSDLRGEDENQTKKSRRSSEFYKEEFAKARPCIKASTMERSYARCTPCQTDFTVWRVAWRTFRPGLFDVKRYIASVRHKKMAATNNSPKIDSIFPTVGTIKANVGLSDEQKAVMNAEALMTMFLVDHHLPLTVADHFGPLLEP